MKPTTKTKHIQSVRNSIKANMHLIMQIDGMTEDCYNNLWIDAGSLFLEEQYPPSDERFERIISRVSKDECFWRWWLNEWKRYENEFMSKFECFSAVTYMTYMVECIYDEYVETGFYENYMSSKTMNFFNQ